MNRVTAIETGCSSDRGHGHAQCLAVVAVTVLATASLAGAATISYEGFNDLTGLIIDGSPTVMSDGALRLASASPQNLAAITHGQALNLESFSTTIRTRTQNPGGIADPTGAVGGDGFFVSFGTEARFNGGVLVNSPLVFQFNTFLNPEIGETGGSNTITALRVDPFLLYDPGVPIEPDFDDGEVWTAWIDYSVGVFEVRVSVDGLRPEFPQLTLPLDLTGALGTSLGYVSVAAYSGDAFGDHDLLAWTVVPSPSSAVVAGMGWLLSARRQR